MHAYRVPATTREEAARAEAEQVGWRAKRGQKSPNDGGLAAVIRGAEPDRLWYFAVAAVVVVGANLLTVAATDDRYTLGYVLYPTIAFFFLVLPGLLAWKAKRLVPFPSLFSTLKDLEPRVRVVAAIILAGLAVLLIHLVLYPWPSIIPDLKDQHDQFQKQREHPKPTTPAPESPPPGAS
jgi:hypothetical protein